MFLKLFRMLIGGSSTSAILKEKIANNPYLIDVRTPGEFKTGSVSNAINIPLDQISLNLDMIKSKRNIIVFCRSGSRSAMAASQMAKSGISDVINGGSWHDVKDALESSKSSW